MVTHVDVVLRNDLPKKKREGNEVFASVITGHDQRRTVPHQNLPAAFDGRSLISLDIQLDEVGFLVL